MFGFVRKFADRLKQPKQSKGTLTAPSRQHRRTIEQTQREAERLFSNLLDAFMTWIVEESPVGEAIIDEKIQFYSKKWILYCKARELDRVAYPMLEEKCKKFCDQNRHLIE